MIIISADRRDVASTPRRNLANFFFIEAVKLMLADFKMWHIDNTSQQLLKS